MKQNTKINKGVIIIMKAIINNKMYDTTTSTVLYTGATETLWKTENGSYFKITPLGLEPMTEDETKAYLGVKDADAYIKEFGEVELA